MLKRNWSDVTAVVILKTVDKRAIRCLLLTMKIQVSVKDTVCGGGWGAGGLSLKFLWSLTLH